MTTSPLAAAVAGRTDTTTSSVNEQAIAVPHEEGKEEVHHTSTKPSQMVCGLPITITTATMVDHRTTRGGHLPPLALHRSLHTKPAALSGVNESSPAPEPSATKYRINKAEESPLQSQQPFSEINTDTKRKVCGYLPTTKIGQGASGAVFLAKVVLSSIVAENASGKCESLEETAREVTDKVVAVKCIIDPRHELEKLRLQPPQEGAGKDTRHVQVLQQRKDLIEKEVALSKLFKHRPHPHIVRIIDTMRCTRRDKYTNIVMEVMEGGSLRDYLNVTAMQHKRRLYKATDAPLPELRLLPTNTPTSVLFGEKPSTTTKLPTRTAEVNILRKFDPTSLTDYTYLLEFSSTPLIREEELKLRGWARHLLEGLRFLHEECGVAHRDIKPDNLLLAKDGATLKIADFGLALRCINSSSPSAAPQRDDDLPHAIVAAHHARCGTRLYHAPECLLIQKQSETLTAAGSMEERLFTYNAFAADIWAAGAILFEIMTGFFPTRRTMCIDSDDFSNTSLHPMPMHHHHHYPNYLSSTVADLLEGLLHPEAEMRLTATQALAHPWFQE